MATVCVLTMKQGYFVGIVWKDSKMRRRFRGTLLGKFNGLGRSGRADGLAQEVASKLSLLVVKRTFMNGSPGTMS